MIKMAIREPRINAMNTTANPLMIVGVFIFVSPFILGAFGTMPDFVRFALMGLGGLFFILGLVMFIAENV